RHDDVECDESMPLPFLNDNDHAAQFDEHDYLYLEPEVNSFFSDDSASDSECDEPSSSDSSSTEPELNALGCTVLPGCACDRRDESYWLKIVKFGKRAIKFQHACDMQPDWMCWACSALFFDKRQLADGNGSLLMLSWIVAAEFCLSLSIQLSAETLCLCQHCRCCCCYCFSCCCCCCLLRLLLLVASYSLMPLHSLCEWNDASMDKQNKKFVNLQSIVTELTVDILRSQRRKVLQMHKLVRNGHFQICS